MNKLTKLTLLFCLLILCLPLISAANKNDIHFTNNSGNSDFGVGKNGPQIKPNFDITNVVAQLFDASSYLNTRCIIYNSTATNSNPPVVANVTVTLTGTNMTCSFGSSVILKKGDVYTIMVVNSTTANGGIVNMGYFNVADPHPINKTNIAYWNGTYYFSGSTVTLYTAATTSTFRNISSDTWPVSIAGSNATFVATNVYTGGTINSFCVTNGSLWGCTTTGTANLSGLYTNSTTLHTITYLSNESGGAFNTTYTSVNVSSTVSRAMAQTSITFYAIAKVTQQNVSGVNVTSVYTTNQTHYFAQGNYSLNATLLNYYPRSFNYSAVALTNTTQNVSYMYSQKLNVSVTNRITGAPITSFDITVSNANYSFSETYLSVNSNITLNLTASVNYTINISASSYISNSTTVLSSSNWTATSLTLSASNHLLFYFINEDNLSPVYNVNWQVIGENYSQNGTTSNISNLANVSALNVDNYELRYWQPVNYTYRSLFFDVPVINVSGTEIRAYMINETLASDFVVTVTDKNNRPVENLIVDLLRRYPINGSTLYYTVEMTKPNLALQGAAPFTAVANTIPYIFRVRRTTDGEVLFQGSGTTSTNLQTVYLIDSNFYIKVNVLSSPFTASRQLRGLSYSLTNTTSTFWLSVSDPSNVASQYCLRVVKDQTNVLSNNCTTSAGVIGVGYTPVNGSIYVAQFIATSSQDDKEYVIASILNDLRSFDAPNWGYTGIFFFILTIIVIGIGFNDKPAIGIPLGGASLLIFTLASLGSIVGLPAVTGAIVSGSLFICSIIIAVVVNAEDR